MIVGLIYKIDFEYFVDELSIPQKNLFIVKDLCEARDKILKHYKTDSKRKATQVRFEKTSDGIKFIVEII